MDSTLRVRCSFLALLIVARKFFAQTARSRGEGAFRHSAWAVLHWGVHQGADLPLPFLARVPVALIALERWKHRSSACTSTFSMESSCGGGCTHCAMAKAYLGRFSLRTLILGGSLFTAAVAIGIWLQMGRWSLVMHSLWSTQARAPLILVQVRSSVLPAQCVGLPTIRQVRL